MEAAEEKVIFAITLKTEQDSESYQYPKGNNSQLFSPTFEQASNIDVPKSPIKKINFKSAEGPMILRGDLA